MNAHELIIRLVEDEDDVPSKSFISKPYRIEPTDMASIFKVYDHDYRELGSIFNWSDSSGEKWKIDYVEHWIWDELPVEKHRSIAGTRGEMFHSKEAAAEHIVALRVAADMEHDRKNPVLGVDVDESEDDDFSVKGFAKDPVIGNWFKQTDTGTGNCYYFPMAAGGNQYWGARWTSIPNVPDFGYIEYRPMLKDYISMMYEPAENPPAIANYDVEKFKQSCADNDVQPVIASVAS